MAVARTVPPRCRRTVLSAATAGVLLLVPVAVARADVHAPPAAEQTLPAQDATSPSPTAAPSPVTGPSPVTTPEHRSSPDPVPTVPPTPTPTESETPLDDAVVLAAAPLVTGHFEWMRGSYRTLTVVGWAVDPSGVADVETAVTVDGVLFHATTDVARYDVGAVYPGTGAGHGFELTVDRLALPGAEAATHEACVTATVADGRTTSLGCRTISTANASIVGHLEGILPTRWFSFGGWAVDTSGAWDVTVRYVIGYDWSSYDQQWPDGVLHTDHDRPDVGAAYPGTGNAHGFIGRGMPMTSPNRACAWAMITLRETTFLGCKEERPRPDLIPIGHLESVTASGSTVTLGGWALEPQDRTPLAVHLYVNGTWGGAVRADEVRTDIELAYPGSGIEHGFSRSFTAGPGTHQVCAYVIDLQTQGGVPIGCHDVTVTPNRLPVGHFEALSASGSTITLRGWALDADDPRPLDVHLYVNGTWGGLVRADEPRGDVGLAYPGSGDLHGFVRSFTGGPGTHEVCAHAIDPLVDAHSSLGCRTVTVG